MNEYRLSRIPRGKQMQLTLLGISNIYCKKKVIFQKKIFSHVPLAHDLDGVKVRGYSVSSLMDSFEWLNRYTVGFGLHHVDFTHPSRPRTPKRSAHYYYQVMRDNGFPQSEDGTPIYGNFRKDFIWSTATASYQVTAH